MTTRLNKRKAAALLEQAKLQVAEGQHEKAVAALQEVAYGSELGSPAPFAVLADAQSSLGRTAEALATLTDGLKRFPGDSDLEARMGQLLVEQGRVEEALQHYQRVRSGLGRDPQFLTRYALGLIRARRFEEAEAALGSALTRGAGPNAKLLLAVARGKRGLYAQAEQIAAAIEQGEHGEQITAAARSIRADCRLFLGDAQGALALWKELREAGRLDEEQLGHMAYAAELSEEQALSDELVKQRTAGGPSAEDLLLFAQIANLRGKGEEAIAHLLASEAAPGERHPGHQFEVLATLGRAKRLLGRRDEARAVLEQAAALPEFRSARLGPKVHIDLGHLLAEEGDFEGAAERFRGALAMDPEEPEAKRALALTARRVAWRVELEASAQAKVEAVRAEVEAMRRRFQVREGEVEALRRELERVRAAQRQAEQKAQQAEEEARRVAEQAEADQQRKVKEELLAREQEIEEKARENVEAALGGPAPGCPEAIRQLILVAERSYQTALYTELPAAAVAVLFSGALERVLFFLFVDGFDRWLSEGNRRSAFLALATRERRGRRVEYFDHFVEAFDRERAGRAPSMGEVGRVLTRRAEPYLAPFAEFLAQHQEPSAGFYDQLASFVLWGKEKLRDPAAHGRGIELGYEELKQFREKLLFDFEGRGQGVLAILLGAMPRE